jgi:superoxide dismutase, Fe-Mn family
MALELSPLPYPTDALAPFMSARTLDLHHGKHHAAYVKKLNELLQDSPLANSSLEDIIRAAATDKSKEAIFDNAAQVWNHDFFWNCMTPDGGRKPDSDLMKQLEQDFGGYDHFAANFKHAAETQFGSGWAWLVLDGGKLKIAKTSNGDNPIAHGRTALLTIDVWEHAYYVDFQNRRPEFIATFLDHLVNWEFVAENFARAHEHAH